MLATLILCLSCQRFQDKFTAVASLCGVDPSSLRADEIFIKFESPQGTELSAATLLTTRSRFLSRSRQAESLAISSRGCVRLPAESGVLQAFSSAEGWSLSQNLDATNGQNFLRLTLQPSPRVSAELQCPAPGFYAHETLPFPLRWTSDGALHAARFEMVAMDEAQQKSFVLFEKPYGQHLTALPQDLRTDALPEGQYLLRLNFHISTEGWDVPGPVPTRTETCPLTILHRRPEVGGLAGYSLQQRVAVFAKDAILPWKTQSPESDLFVCREKRGQDMDDENVAANAGVCEPQVHCQDLKNFQKAAPIVATETGVFDYYVYAENRAGTRSSLSCQTLVITEHKPELQLVWSEANWNKPAAQMQTPRADVQLRIMSQHPQLEDASLPTGFQCRADFVREDQSILSGRSILCTSGRCRHRTLENFVPCDADLQLAITDLWPRMKPEGGRLRIFVQADDRAGHVIEQVATVGIQPQRWKPVLRSPGTDLNEYTQHLLQDKQRRIFQSKHNGLSLWNETEQRWDLQASPSEVTNGYLERVWLSQEGQVYVAWSLSQAEHIFRWQEGNWEKLPSLENNGPCLNPQGFHRGGFWCRSETDLALYEKDSWTRIPYPVESSCGELNQTQVLVRDQGETLWLACRSELYQRREGQNTWTPVSGTLPLVNIGVDAQERLWIIRGTGARDLQIAIMQNGESRMIPQPESFTWVDLRSRDFAIGPGGEIILGDAYWDDSKSAWQVFPYLANRQPGQRVLPYFLSHGELFWESEQGLLHWDGTRLRHWDFAVHGLQLVTETLQVVLDANGAPWILASPGGSYTFPYQFQLKNWAYWTKPAGAPSSAIAALWVDERSTPRVYIPADGFHVLESSGWNRLMRSPGITEESPLDTGTFEPILLSPEGIYRWSPEEDWTRLVHFPEPRYYFGGTRDAQGRIWVYQDSMELGVIHGSRFERVPLGTDAGSSVYDIFARDNGITVATDRGLFSRAEGQVDWSSQLWTDWGLASVDRVRQVDSDTLLVSISGEGGLLSALWLLDLKTQSKKEFRLPESTAFLGNVQKTSKGDYVMALRFDVFRTDGVNYTKLFSRKDFDELSSVSGVFPNVFDLQVDAHDRVWFHTGHGIIRIDL
ncbi:hypothetical protein [Oligoflexus tunisiensis]|uniref:hypothetical protein n=1 Tax=Oligoflexus tunisiensis TaxID=708132 RepID=UPI001C405D39|nr:hypothetical protein [Oligoflexus tunisiensis]